MTDEEAAEPVYQHVQGGRHGCGDPSPQLSTPPFISHLEQKNEEVKFLRIDADLNETFKEKEEDDEAARRGYEGC